MEISYIHILSDIKMKTGTAGPEDHKTYRISKISLWPQLPMGEGKREITHLGNSNSQLKDKQQHIPSLEEPPGFLLQLFSKQLMTGCL